MPNFHIDPLNILLLIVAMLTSWRAYSKNFDQLQSDSNWHSSWIKHHSTECDKRDRDIASAIVELKTASVQLTEIAKSNAERIGKTDEEVLRIRDSVHDLREMLPMGNIRRRAAVKRRTR